MMPQRFLVVAGAMCSAGLVWCAVLAGTLLAGVRLMPTAAAVGIAALLVVPGVIAGITGNRWYYRTTRPRRAWSLTSWVPPHVPHWVLAVSGVVFAGFWLIVVLAFAGLDGETGWGPGSAPEAKTAREVVLEQQISIGVLGALAAGGTFMTGAVLTHHNAPQPTVTQSAGQPLA